MSRTVDRAVCSLLGADILTMMPPTMSMLAPRDAANTLALTGKREEVSMPSSWARAGLQISICAPVSATPFVVTGRELRPWRKRGGGRSRAR